MDALFEAQWWQLGVVGMFDGKMVGAKYKAKVTKCEYVKKTQNMSSAAVPLQLQRKTRDISLSQEVSLCLP